MSNVSSEYYRKLGGGWQRQRDRSERDKKIHTVFNLVGLLAGGGAAYIAWDLSNTISLPIFAFFAANYFFGRGLGDLITDQQKVKRFFYFALPVAIDTGILYLTYQWWGLMWLSVLIGFFVGGALWGIAAGTMFADIHEQETEDNRRRVKEAVGQ
jgi:hypothetical protein